MRISLTPLFICLIAISACSVKYDIDVKCVRVELAESDAGVTTNFECMAPDYFLVKCDKNTIQKIGDDISCSTFDGKKVHISRFYSAQ